MRMMDRLCRRGRIEARRPESNQAEQVGEVHKPLHLGGLVFREGVAAILLVEERLQPALDPFRKQQARHVLGELDLQADPTG